MNQKCLIGMAIYLPLGFLVSACQKMPVQNQVFNPATTAANVRFVCGEGEDRETQKRLPTTYALVGPTQKAIIRWESDRFSSSGWQKEKRCQEVASRLENAYNNNTLNIITNGQMNGQPVICIALTQGGDCQDLLLTLKPEDDGSAIVKQIGEILNGQPMESTRESSGETGQVYMQLSLDRFAQMPAFQEE